MVDHLKPYQFKPGDPRCKGKSSKKESAKDICDRMNFDPLEFEILVAQDQWKLLGLKGPVSVNQRSKSAQFVGGKIYPSLKAVEIRDDFDAGSEEDRVVVILPSNDRELESEIKVISQEESVMELDKDLMMDMARKVDLAVDTDEKD